VHQIFTLNFRSLNFRKFIILEYSTRVLNLVLKINCSKFTRGLEPLNGDARSAKSFEFLILIFSTDCSPIDWLQSVLKITRFENVFPFFFV
jgi:hypothetical protein